VKNITEKLFYFLVPALFTFPLFKESVSTFLFILLAMNTICYLIATKNYRLNTKILYFTIPFWIIFVNCLFYFNTIDNLRAVKNSLYFLLFPIVFNYIPLVHFSKEKVVFYLNILKNVVAIIAVSYVAAFLYYYDFSDFFVYKYAIPKFRDFIYNEIPFFKIHPTYYASIVFLCCAFSFDKVLKDKKYAEMIYVCIFIFITFLILAKANIVLLLLLLFAMLLFRSGFSFRQKAASASLLLFTVIILTFTVPGIKKRFVEVFNSYNSPPSGMSYDSTNVRVAIYKCCWSIAQDNYLYGVGFTHIGSALENCYEENYDSYFYKQQGYLSHNYFFYIFLSSGIFGLMLYLFYVYKVARAAIKINDFLLSVSLINIFIMCLSEDFFYRQFGLFFYSLVFFTFYNSKIASAETPSIA
jgi:O-antigen ligase